MWITLYILYTHINNKEWIASAHIIIIKPWKYKTRLYSSSWKEIKQGGKNRTSFQLSE